MIMPADFEEFHIKSFTEDYGAEPFAWIRRCYREVPLRNVAPGKILGGASLWERDTAKASREEACSPL
jgi:hypothetical protein